MIVYRTTDRIPIKLDGLTVWVAPLTYEHKMKLAQTTKMVAGTEVIDSAKVAVLSLKFSVKQVEGLTDSDGNAYELSFDSDGNLSDESVSDLMQVAGAWNLAAVCYKLSLEIASHKLDGVEVVLSETRKTQKKT